MEKFIIPKDKRLFVKWIVKYSFYNNLIVIIESSEQGASEFLSLYAKQTDLPPTAQHHYNKTCLIVSFINMNYNDDVIEYLLKNVHVLSIHNSKEMKFLIADDFNEECFSCSKDFYYKHYDNLIKMGLINTNYDNRHLS